MLFCPYCSNILIIASPEGLNFWQCNSCPYKFEIKKEMVTRTRYKRKEVDDVLGGEGSWANVDKTDVICPKCDGPQAYYRQMQIRSADEPMTTFYRCINVNCEHQWREN